MFWLGVLQLVVLSGANDVPLQCNTNHSCQSIAAGKSLSIPCANVLANTTVSYKVDSFDCSRSTKYGVEFKDSTGKTLFNKESLPATPLEESSDFALVLECHDLLLPCLVSYELDYQVGPPSQPSVPRLQGVPKPTSVDLVWDKPDNTHGSLIVGYTVYSVKHGETERNVVCEATDLSCHAGNLSPSTTYSITVVARNSAGASVPSPGLSVTLPAGTTTTTTSGTTTTATTDAGTTTGSAPNDSIVVIFTAKGPATAFSLADFVEALAVVMDAVPADIHVEKWTLSPADGDVAILALTFYMDRSSVDHNRIDHLIHEGRVVHGFVVENIVVHNDWDDDTKGSNMLGVYIGVPVAVLILAVGTFFFIKRRRDTPMRMSPMGSPRGKASGFPGANDGETDALLKGASERLEKRSCCTKRRAAAACCAGVLLVGATIGIVLGVVLNNASSGSDGPPPPPAVTVPGAPGAVFNVSYGITTQSIGWHAPEKNGGSTVVLYMAEATKESDKTNVQSMTTRETRITFENLTANTGYLYRVRAQNSAGYGTPSTPTLLYTLPPTAPARPAPISVKSTSRESIGVAWNAPDPNGAAITSYTLQLCAGEDGPFSDVYKGPHLVGAATALTAGSLYGLRVAALNDVGPSAWSPTIFLHTDTSGPISPPGAPEDFHAISSTRTSASFTWMPPHEDGGSYVRAYLLEIKQGNPGDPGGYATAWEGSSTATTVHGLTQDTLYSLRLKGENSQGYGTVTPPITITTRVAHSPGECKKPYLTGTGPLDLKIAWDAPKDDGGEDITAYELEGDDWWKGTPLASLYTGLPRAFTSKDHLLPGSIYNYRVRAKNAVGEGNWSEVVPFNTDDDGGCGNAADMKLWKSEFDSLQSDVQGCMIAHVTDKNKARQCIMDKVGLSYDCSECWIENGLCALSKCAAQCISPHSAACTQCSRDKCFPATVTCTGLPLWVFPGL